MTKSRFQDPSNAQSPGAAPESGGTALISPVEILTAVYDDHPRLQELVVQEPEQGKFSHVFHLGDALTVKGAPSPEDAEYLHAERKILLHADGEGAPKVAFEGRRHGTAYVILARTPGETLEAVHADKPGEDELRAIGTGIGRDAARFTAQFTVTEREEMFSPTDPRDTPPRTPEEIMALVADANVRHALGKSYQKVLRAMYDHAGEEQTPEIACQNDLRPENIMIRQVDGKWQYSGTIDYGLAARRPAHEAFMELAHGPRAVLDAACEAFSAESGIRVEPRQVLRAAIASELKYMRDFSSPGASISGLLRNLNDDPPAPRRPKKASPGAKS
jgi:hypothetical protein